MNDDRGWSLDQLRTLLREEIRAEMRQGPKRASETVSAAWAGYAKTWAMKTWASSVRGLMVAVLAYFGDYKLDEVTPAEWIEYRDNVRSKAITRMGGPPTARSHNLELARTKAFLNWCVDEGKLEHNPLARLKKLKAKRKRNTEPDPAGVAEAMRSLPRLVATYVFTVVRSGLRPNEARNIEWSWLDYQRGRIELPWSVTKTKEARSVPMPSDLAQALRALDHVLGSPFVFANPETRKPYSRDWMWRQVRHAFDAAGLEAAPGDGNVHLHDCRAGWFTEMLRRGGFIGAVSMAGGHADIKTTALYVRVKDSDLDDLKQIAERKPAQKTSGEPWHDSETTSQLPSHPSPTTKSK